MKAQALALQKPVKGKKKCGKGKKGKNSKVKSPKRAKKPLSDLKIHLGKKEEFPVKQELKTLEAKLVDDIIIKSDSESEKSDEEEGMTTEKMTPVTEDRIKPVIKELKAVEDDLKDKSDILSKLTDKI